MSKKGAMCMRVVSEVERRGYNFNNFSHDIKSNETAADFFLASLKEKTFVASA